MENSHLIQVYSSECSIWRGFEWSTIKCAIKIDACFRSQSSSVNEEKYHLHILVENCQNGERIYKSRPESILVSFDSDTNADEGGDCKTYENIHVMPITQNPYMEVHVKINKNLFNNRDKFRILAAVAKSEMRDLDQLSDFIFGASQEIVVSNLALRIENVFSSHPKISKLTDELFVYYSKMGELGKGLNVNIHLLDENCAPRKVLGKDITLKAELVYEDNNPVPAISMSKNRLSRVCDIGKERDFFILLSGEPVIKSGESSASLYFNIDEVTYHHHGHEGFKIRVSASNRESLCVHPGIMNSLIAVLSKPKRQSGLDVITKVKESTPVVIMRSNKRKAGEIGGDSLSLTVPTGKSVSIPMHAIYDTFICNGFCFFCNARVMTQNVLVPTSHYIDCTLAVRVLPILQGIAIPFKFERPEIPSAPSTPLPDIIPSKSFEEGPQSMEQIAENMFEDLENMDPYTKLSTPIKSNSNIQKSLILSENYSFIQKFEDCCEIAQELSLNENISSSREILSSSDANIDKSLHEDYSFDDDVLDFYTTVAILRGSNDGSTVTGKLDRL